jgi:hypothetical protein
MQSVFIWSLQPVLQQVAINSGPLSLQLLGHSVAGDSRFHHRDDIDGSDRPPGMHRQASPGVFIQQRKDAKDTAIFGLVGHNIPAPHLAPGLSARCRSADEIPKRFYDFFTHPENSLRNRAFEILKQNGLAFYHSPTETLSLSTSDRLLQKAQVLHKVPHQKPKILTTVVAASKNRTRFRVTPKKRIRPKAAIMVTPVRRVDRAKRLALERSAR